MRNPAISPRFDGTAPYKGQDVVHRGVRIPLQGYMPLDLLIKFDKSAQQRIKLSAQDDSGIKYMDMVDDHLFVLRKMWFDPSDDTFPNSMQGHEGITAFHGGVIVGGIIWTPEGKNLFMHQLVSNAAGKDLAVPTLLIWQSVVKFCGKEYNALDVGVSYNPKRYAFFKQFAVETYPIILKPPAIMPVIRLTPFRGFVGLKEKEDPMPEEAKGRITVLPRAAYALYAALKHIGVGPGDQVCIVKTFGSKFISKCVTDIIEKTGATWGLRVLDNSKAVVAIHEFGVPIFQEPDLDIVSIARNHKIPIIEDCAWRSTPVWASSEYCVFSASKLYPMNYGGMLLGVEIPDDKLWEWGILDTFKRDRIGYEFDHDLGEHRREENWMRYHELAKADGMMLDDCYDYEKAVNEGKWTPTMYLQKFKSEDEAELIVKRLEDFGIEAGRYWGEPLVYLPIHQGMTEAEVEYMFAVVKGFFNPCNAYGK